MARNRFKEGSGSNPLLFLGNSQTLAIMDEKPGDLTTPQWLQILLLRRGGAGPAPQVILGSLPNQTMAEFLITLVAASQWRRYPVQLVVGGIALREWRGLSVRDSVVSWAAAPLVRNELTSLIEASPDLRFADVAIEGSIKAVQTGNGVASQARSQTVAARFEQDVQNAAAEIPLFKMRTYLYMRIHVSYMGLRNWLFGIHTDTPRAIPKPTYRASLQLLELSLRYARSLRLKIVLYLAPVRPIQPNPTLPSDLATFRKDVFGPVRKVRGGLYGLQRSGSRKALVRLFDSRDCRRSRRAGLRSFHWPGPQACRPANHGRRWRTAGGGQVGAAMTLQSLSYFVALGGLWLIARPLRNSHYRQLLSAGGKLSLLCDLGFEFPGHPDCQFAAEPCLGQGAAPPPHGGMFMDRGRLQCRVAGNFQVPSSAGAPVVRRFRAGSDAAHGSDAGRCFVLDLPGAELPV